MDPVEEPAEDESDAAVIASSLHVPARFGAIFDRHATVLHRYLVRRLGPDEADGMLGEVFRVAFEKRHTYDLDRPLARPWLYGIATNLVSRHRRSEARRIRAMARLGAQRLTPDDDAERVSAAVDAAERWQKVAAAVTSLPEPERDALVLHTWESLSYDEIADALGIPVGTVRSRLHRARRRLRELVEVGGGQEDESTYDPQVFSRAKESLMTTIDETHPASALAPTPDIYARLAYNDELAAVDYLTRVFGLVEIREARSEYDGQFLCWLRVGTGMVMLGRANPDVHHIHSPLDSGLTTVMLNVYVQDVDAHHAHAVAEGADITLELGDAFFGERRYEAVDLEGHRWHFGERFEDIKARGGRPPAPGGPTPG